jgi:hypothetical protein
MAKKKAAKKKSAKRELIAPRATSNMSDATCPASDGTGIFHRRR